MQDYFQIILYYLLQVLFKSLTFGYFIMICIGMQFFLYKYFYSCIFTIYYLPFFVAQKTLPCISTLPKTRVIVLSFHSLTKHTAFSASFLPFFLSFFHFLNYIFSLSRVAVSGKV